MNNKSCPKSGIKIHLSNNELQNGYNDDQLEFYNKIKGENKKTGVRITNNKNHYEVDPFDGANPFNNPDGDVDLKNIIYNPEAYHQLDLDVDNYSHKDVYKLFGITEQLLTHDIMKKSKKIVLKTHPDKSRLEPKYFLFFTKAYKRLYAIYEFQNKNTNKSEDNTSYESKEHTQLLTQFFEKDKSLKDPTNFNKWFNDQFDKHKIDDSNNTGYGDWLKSDDNVDEMNNISQSQLNEEIERKKRQVKDIVSYQGIESQYTSTMGGSVLLDNNSNFSSALYGNDMNFTDLKQAYVESVIPITQDDYNNIPKYNSVDEYQRSRDNAGVSPISKDESLKQLYKENKQQEEESVALAYYYAKQAEQSQQKQQTFWATIKQLGNG